MSIHLNSKHFFFGSDHDTFTLQSCLNNSELKLTCLGKNLLKLGYMVNFNRQQNIFIRDVRKYVSFNQYVSESIVAIIKHENLEQSCTISW